MAAVLLLATFNKSKLNISIVRSLIIICICLSCFSCGGGGVGGLGKLSDNYIYVATNGNEANDGSPSNPLGNIQSAIDLAIIKGKNGVKIFPGEYFIDKGLEISKVDNFTLDSIVPRSVILKGTKKFNVVIDNNSNKANFKLPKDIRLTGFSSKNELSTDFYPKVFHNDNELRITRFPSQGFSIGYRNDIILEGDPISQVSIELTDKLPISNSEDASNIFIHFFPRFLWADSYERNLSIDVNSITIKNPDSKYGYSSKIPFYLINFLSGVGSNGDYAFDSNNNLYISQEFSGKDIEVSILNEPLVSILNSSNITVSDIEFSNCSCSAIYAENSSGVNINRSRFKRLSESAVFLVNTNNSIILNNNFLDLGKSGIKIFDTDLYSSQKNNSIIKNNSLINTSTIFYTYNQAISIHGNGIIVTNNEIKQASSSAIRIDGFDNLIVYNEISRVMLNSADQGAIDMWGNPLYSNNSISYNYFHDISYLDYVLSTRYENLPGWAAIRLDNLISDVRIHGNIFSNIFSTSFGAVTINGGSDITVTNNYFLNCSLAVEYFRYSNDEWRVATLPFLEILSASQNINISERYPYRNFDKLAVNKMSSLNSYNFLYESRLNKDLSDYDIFVNNFSATQSEYLLLLRRIFRDGIAYKFPADFDFINFFNQK